MEKTIESYLRRRVRDAGLMPGARVYFAETKDTGKKPKPRQKYVHGRLRELGFSVFVPDSKEAVDDMVITITEGAGT